MTREEIEDLLLKDLSARFPYGVKGQVTIEVANGTYDIYSGHLEFDDVDVDVVLLGIQEEEIIVSTINDKYDEIVNSISYSCSDFTPYLRSLSSMTEEELKEYKHCLAFGGSSHGAADFVDWLNKHHFDYRGLIEKKLAIEVTEENNPYKE